VSGGRGLLLRALLALGALLAALLVVELGFRATGRGDPVVYEDLVLSWEPSAPFVAAPDEGYQLMLAPHFQGRQIYRDALSGREVLSVPVRTDAHGLRGEDRAADPGALRVLALGDSVTFGQGVPEEGALPAQLEHLLSLDREVQVLNAGVPSWNLPHELAWLQRHGFGLEPDLVLWMFYVNDVSAAQRNLAVDQDQPVHLGAPAWAAGEGGLRRYSFAYNAVWRAVERRRLARELLRPAPSFRLEGRSYLDELREDLAAQGVEPQLDELARACEAFDVACAVVVLPVLIAGKDDRGEDILDTVASAAEAAGLPVVRIDDALDELSPAERYVLPGDRHPSASAHRRMAERLAERLTLPPPASP
jgi:lysophospholipase L1-like esterase